MDKSSRNTHNQAVFPACVDQIPVICSTINDAARGAGMAEPNIWKFETAVDEACTNIACYGYQGQCSGEIRLVWQIQNGNFVLTIEDEGIPFDQSEPTNPDLECDICKRKIGGLGRHIMRNFLDEMVYKRVGKTNCLIMVKSLREQNQAAAS